MAIVGDPHASERIGPSCSRTQAGITLTGLMAASKGANLQQINILQEATRGAVLRFAIIYIITMFGCAYALFNHHTHSY